ncbi:hypothetical protein DXG01_003579, partial [Tephrocybe rancida]
LNGKKPSPFKRFLGQLGASKSTKTSLISSTPVTHSLENLAAPASAAQLAANILSVATAPAVPGAAASAPVVIAVGPTLVINVKQDNPMTPATAAPTVATKVNQGSSTIPAAMNSASLTNMIQSTPPGPNVSQDQSKFKEGVTVALDGFLTALRVAKEASEWNPFLKAALGGIVAVIDLGKTVSSNSEDMKDTLAQIEGLLLILETFAKCLEGCNDDFGKESNLLNFAIVMQTELVKIQEMQPHGLFRHVLQGPKDATEALEKDLELVNAKLDIQLIQMLIQPWEASVSECLGLPPLIIVINALDENQSGSVFLKYLLHAVGATRLSGLKFFVTSREGEQISIILGLKFA